MTPTPRIRCNYCNRRIPAYSVVCPNCQRNPRAFYWKRWHILPLLLILALALAAFFLTIGANFVGSALNGFKPFTASVFVNPTPTFTRAPITVIIVATRKPATATRVVPTAVRTDTPTPSPTISLTPTVTITGTRPPTVPPPTETPSPFPTIVPVPAPKLVSPGDGARITGGNKHLILQYQPAEPISAPDWYRVQVDFLDRAGNPVSWCGFTKESAQEFPRDFFDDSSPSVRSFLWRVNVVRSNQIVPATCDAPYDVLSAPSEVWTFYWY